LNESPQQTEKIFCNTCNTVTNHALRFRYSTPRIEHPKDGPDPARYANRYSLWCCQGCDEATLERQSASEDRDEEWEAAGGEYYPRRLNDCIQAKFFINLNGELRRLYDEVISCFNVDCLLLCSVGLRSLIEGICQDQGLNGKELWQKIDGLKALIPNQNLIDSLHSFKFSGNDAVHHRVALTRDEAKTAIDVMDDVLNFLYDLDYKASQMKNASKQAEFRSLKNARPN
jgi:hypothetical protein